VLGFLEASGDVLSINKPPPIRYCSNKHTNGLEEQAENAKARELFWKPLSWLGTIRPTSANDAFDPALWETFDIHDARFGGPKPLPPSPVSIVAR
jgi:hypothetical protein